VTALENVIVHGLDRHKLQQPLPPLDVQVTIVAVGAKVGDPAEYVGIGVGLPGR